MPWKSSMIDSQKIRTTIEVLSALDAIQGNFYQSILEPALRKRQPHSDSLSLQTATKGLQQFIELAPMGNGQGIDMHCSALIGGMKLMGMDKEAETAIIAHQEK